MAAEDLSFLDRLNTTLVPVSTFEVADPEEDNFEFELSDFVYVSKGIRNGRALRFTVTWQFKHPKYGLLGESEEGWLCTRNSAGQLHCSPPITRFGPAASKQLKQITNDYHALVLGLLVNVKTKAGTSYADYIGNAIPEELRAKLPGEIDGELPQELKA